MDFQDYKSKLSEKQLDLLAAVESRTLTDVHSLGYCSFQNFDQDKQYAYILLVAALQRRHKSIIIFLINNGVPVKLFHKTGLYCTPLYYAVKMNNLEIFIALCWRGASIWETDANKESALELAMVEDRSTMIKYVLNVNELFELPDKLELVALFHAACWFGNLKAIEMFISRNFSLRSRSGFVRDEWKGFTPLHFVLNGSHADEKLVAILLEHNDIDFYAQDERGKTCINLAFRRSFDNLLKNENIIDRVRDSNGSQSINPVDKNGLSHFHIFCSMKSDIRQSEKHLDFIRRFIANGVDVNSSVSLEDEEVPGFTALHFAVEVSSWHVAKLLLENGADPTRCTKKGSTPLHMMIRNIHYQREHALEMVKLLLHYGADPGAKDSYGRTLLHGPFAIHRSDVRPLNEIEKLILSKSQKGVNYTDNTGVSYFHIACTGDDIGILETLVANGASVNTSIPTNAYQYAGYSPLRLAIESLQDDVVEFLLTHGAEPNCVDREGSTPLHWACRYEDVYCYPPNSKPNEIDDIDWPVRREKQIRIIESLIKHGASVDAKNSSGRTPLLENCSMTRDLSGYLKFFIKKSPPEKEILTRQIKVMDILLRHGADINACCTYGGTILHILIENLQKRPRNKDLIEIALERGACVNAVEKNRGITPLNLAVEVSMRDKLDISGINLLLEHGADINGKSRYLETPLHKAIRCYQPHPTNEDIIESLLNHPEIDLNVEDEHGYTLLHAVVCKHNHFLIKKFLDFGVNINMENKVRHSPFSALLSALSNRRFSWNGDIPKILQAIITCTKKLTKLNFLVSDNVKSCVSKLSKYLPKDELASIDAAIDTEVNQLQSYRIDQYTSLYSILFKGPNSLAKYAQNENLIKVITLIRSGQDFVIFGDILNRQYIRGCRRHLVIEPAKIALNVVTNMNWPYCCSEQILNSLSDQELKNLIKSMPDKEIRESLFEDLPLSEDPVPKKSRTDER